MLNSMLTEAREAWDQLRWGWNDPVVREQERGQITLVGLSGSGKKTLFNCLLGWTAATQPATIQDLPGRLANDYGLFALMDLPLDGYLADEALFQLEGAALVVYVLDGAAGLRNDDFRWISRLRSCRAPLLVVLNKVDILGEQLICTQTEIETRLSMSILPVCARNRADVQGLLASEMMRQCPKLTVPLAAQIKSVRHEAALRLIRQSMAISLLASVEPLPLLDVSVLIGLQIHLVSRIGALYGQSIASQSQWALVLTVSFGLALRYVIQTILKFVPFGGWLVSGVIGASGTWTVGQAALTFYESGRTPQGLSQQLVKEVGHALSRYHSR